MARAQANETPTDRTARAIALICVAVVVLATLIVEVRWRAGRELAAGVPLPRLGVLVASESVPEPDPGPVPRSICAYTIAVGAARTTALDAYEALLVAAGWDPRGEEPQADVPTRAYRDGPRRLTVALLEPDAASRARLRVRLRPCDDPALPGVPAGRE